jgi:Flp pilus assembly protein TadD
VLDAEQNAHEVRDGEVPASSEVYLQLGAAYERIGDHGRARVAYRAAQAAFERSRNDTGVERARTLLQRLDS